MASSGLAENERSAEKKLLESLATGRAAEIFGKMVTELGGPADLLEKSEKYLPKPKVILEYQAKSSGFITESDGRILGEALIELGGGRRKFDESLDHSVGLDRIVRLDSSVKAGDSLMRICAADENTARRVASLLDKAFVFSDQPMISSELIMQTISYDQ